MGTRALTFVYDGERPIINLYRQYDGYPSGHGAELAQFLEGFKIVNGLGAKTPTRIANGMGCLAAQLVAHFKTEAGQFYLHSPEEKDCGQDYEYHVYKLRNTGELQVAVTNRGCNFFGLTTSDVNESIFDGSVADFVRFCSEEELA
jgi:hypothetical protein